MIIDVEGGTVFCAVTGNGPPLMIPGNASTPRFMQVAKHFSDDFTVIGHDVRGEASKQILQISPSRSQILRTTVLRSSMHSATRRPITSGSPTPEWSACFSPSNTPTGLTG